MTDRDGVMVAKLLYNNTTCFLEITDEELKRGALVVVETENGPEIASISGISLSLSNITLSPLPTPSSIKNGLIKSDDQVRSSKVRLSRASKKLCMPFSGSPSISRK